MIVARRQPLQGIYLVLLIRGLLGLALGALILASPCRSLSGLAWLIAGVALAGGASETVHALAGHSPLRAWWWLICAAGVLNLSAQCLAFFAPTGLSLALFTAWIALSLELSEAGLTLSSLQLKQLGVSWVASCALGLLAVSASICALLHPDGLVVLKQTLLVLFIVAGGTVLLDAARRARVHFPAVPSIPEADDFGGLEQQTAVIE